ncbi:hypothetical protein HK096_001617 [Nowakowskiella sp. JEL0078]|nr:hypothetical protein HK096_001617 [Nowakowskiella sp. JEL0078]
MFTPNLSIAASSQFVWIFPPNIISDLLNSYFQSCNAWPTNIIHEETFMATWISQPPELVYSLCARGAEFNYQHLELLTFEGKRAGDSLFNQSKMLMDLDCHSFNNLLTLIQLIEYATKIGKFKTAQIYSSMIPAMCEILKLHVDPDELEITTGHKWTLIEKDMRRRAWWSARIHADNSMCKLRSNVQSPLSNRIFSVLPNSIYELNGVCLPSSSGLSLIPELDPHAQKLSLISEITVVFHQNSLNNVNFGEILEEAKAIYSKLSEWIANLPEWVHGVATPSKVHSKQSLYLPNTHEFWRSWSLCIQYHSVVLNLFRFLLVDLCKKNGGLRNSEFKNEQFEVLLGQAYIAAQGIKTFLSEILTRYDPAHKRVDMVTLLAIQNTGTFLAILSRFSENDSLRKSANQEFTFLRNLCLKIGVSGQKVFSNILQHIDSLNTIPVEQCIERLNALITGPGNLTQFECQLSDLMVPITIPINPTRMDMSSLSLSTSLDFSNTDFSHEFNLSSEFTGCQKIALSPPNSQLDDDCNHMFDFINVLSVGS